MLNTVEVNGFYVDTFNQYNLQVGKAESVCPLCSHQRKPENKKKKCASLDWERGLGTCHNCNKTFQLHTYLRKGGSDIEYKRPEFSTKTHKPAGSKVLEWFKSRGISKKTVEDLNISEGPEYMPQTGKEENAIKFNYMIGDQLINIKYRDARKNFKLYKGAEKIFYNINSIIGYNWCVIVEGEMDAAAIHEIGIRNVISVPNGATLNHNNLDYLDSCIDYFADKEKIIIAVDNDTAGEALKQELIRRLGSEVCFTVDFGEYKDANELLLADKDKLLHVIEKAQPVPLENVTTFKDLENELQDFVKNGFKPGFQIGINNFDAIFSTYTGQFITVTGIPSSGKSDFVDQMVIGYNIGYNWKIGFASPENAPTYLHAHKIMRKIWGGMPSQNDIGSERWEKVSNHINSNYYFIDLEVPTLESVLRKGAELVKRKGIKCLVIDPFNKIRDVDAKSMDVNTYTLEYLTKIEQFAKRYDVLVIIVAHPTKMYKDSSGKIEEPTMYNIKGGGEWYDASYHGLLVHRDYENKTTKVKVLKVKFQNLGENGAEAYFTWEPRSGSYIPHYNKEEEKEDQSKYLPWEK